MSMVSGVALAGLTGGLPLAGGLSQLGGIASALGPVSQLASGAIPGIGNLAQTALSACGPAVGGLLSAGGPLSGVLTGALPAGAGSLLSAAGISMPDPNNLFSSVVAQGQKFLGEGMAGLTSIVSSVSSFTEQAFNAAGTLDFLKNMDLPGGDIGSLTRNFTDMAQGSINRILESVPGTDVFKSVTDSIGKIGSMLPLNGEFNLNGMAQNLLGQGLPSVQKALDSVGIGLDALQDVTRNTSALIEKGFGSLAQGAINEIVDRTGFSAANGLSLSKLTDVINRPEMLLNDLARSVIPNAQELGSKIASLNPMVDSFQQLGTTLNRLEGFNFPRIDAVVGDRNSWSQIFDQGAANRRSLIGSGDSVFGTPTVQNVMGTFIGKTYAEKFTDLQQIQARLTSTSAGQTLSAALRTAITNAGGDPGPGGTSVITATVTTAQDTADAAAILAAAQPFLNPTDPNIQADMIMANSIINQIVNDYILEIQNLRAARIDLTDSPRGNISDIMAFVINLGNLGQDDFGLGLRQAIEDMTTDDIYGEAIRGAIVEGINRNILAEIGINPPTLVDPVLWGSEVSEIKRQFYERCCP